MNPFLQKAAALVVTAVALALLALSLAGYAGRFRYLELLADFRPYYLAAGTIWLLVSVALWRLKIWRRVRTAGVVICGMVVALNGAEVLPWLTATPARTGSGPGHTPLKAIAFNVEGGNTRYAQTRAFVEQEKPDLAFFCESTGLWPAELRPLEHLLPHHVRIDSMHMDVFSRSPIVSTQLFHYGRERGFAVIGLDVDGRPLTFVTMHTYPRHWLGAEGFRQRTLALEGLGQEAASLGRPLIVMGDLNASPWSPAYKNMLRRSGLHDGRRGFGLLMTHRGHGPVLGRLWHPIDHCLHSPDVEIRRIWTGPDLNSDHLPVLAEVLVCNTKGKP